MVKVSVLYPNEPGGRFDMEYYQSRHVPLVIERCAGAIRRGEIERGIAGAEPGTGAPFSVTAHLLFDSVDAVESSFGRHLAEFIADLPNFTNIQPVVQIGEVLL